MAVSHRQVSIPSERDSEDLSGKEVNTGDRGAPRFVTAASQGWRPGMGWEWLISVTSHSSMAVDLDPCTRLQCRLGTISTPPPTLYWGWTRPELGNMSDI